MGSALLNNSPISGDLTWQRYRIKQIVSLNETLIIGQYDEKKNLTSDEEGAKAVGGLLKRNSSSKTWVN